MVSVHFNRSEKSKMNKKLDSSKRGLLVHLNLFIHVFRLRRLEGIFSLYETVVNMFLFFIKICIIKSCDFIHTYQFC